MLPLMLLFWAFALYRVADYPQVHFDEPVILSPGYKLFHEGVFGSDLYTGFYGQEQLFLEVPPTMSLLQGFSTALLNVGIWQMRFLPVVTGLLLLPLTFVIASRLGRQKWVGLLAAFLLLWWRWTPGGDPFLGSGVLLLDVSRLARYDILVPLFALGGFWLWLQGRRNGRPVYDVGAGLLVGLAGLSNVYGLFWAAALILLYIIDYRQPSRWPALLRFILGAALPWLVWLLMLVTHLEWAQGQFGKHSGRFDLLSPSFYLQNLRAEVHRYALGLRRPATYLRAGFWLVVVGIPAGSAWLIYRFFRFRDRHALYLLVPTILIPFFLGLLESSKRTYYLLAWLPLTAIVIAWGLVALVAWGSNRPENKARRPVSVAFMAFLLIVFLQGLGGVSLAARQANQAISQPELFAWLREQVPAEGRIMASPIYWLAFPERDFRSEGLLFVLSNPNQSQLYTFAAALEWIRPDIILLEDQFETQLDLVEDHYGFPRRASFDAFMAAHQAQLIAESATPTGSRLRIYQLQWATDP